ncbi:MAG TPA: YidB family protein [Candidatus Udaeobacter sp.]
MVESTDANTSVKLKAILAGKLSFTPRSRLVLCVSTFERIFQRHSKTNNQRRKQIMGLLDSILGAVSGKTEGSGGAAQLIGVLGGLLAQSGGLQGLASKFAQSGHGNAFQSWVGMGENEAVSSNQVQNALGSEQVNALAAKMGVDPAVASNFLAEYLPKIVDKLTPAGKIDPAADHQQGLAALLPSLLQSLSGQSSSDQPAQA